MHSDSCIGFRGERKRMTERDSGRKRECRQTNRQIDRRTVRQSDKQINRQLGNLPYRQIDRQTDREAERKIERLTNRQTDSSAAVRPMYSKDNVTDRQPVNQVST